MYYDGHYVVKLGYEYNFPDPLLSSNAGLLAYGGDLSPNRVLMAYRKGIFPWYSKDDPILWWSPNPRVILELDDFKIRKSLKKRIKNGGFIVKFDTAFNQVIKNCSSIKRFDQDESWILPEMIELYTLLYKQGYAHSIETYKDDELVGGLYGVSIGKVFFGESMFSKVSDASKIAFAFLVDKLKEMEFHFIDAQVKTDHLLSLGAKEISREHFLNILNTAIDEEPKNNWK